ncbi:protein kinase domain-containing protein [Streptomyces peucetius]|uniref:PQQ-binding-like beta-propeller repeat protein n=1 Tax=Streptomyces peucetius TaxID=1950 RepID=A0ABY6IHY0_STRPE|nr:PQQ-binding-like beta-propeller repeat protein [Streptomyces peucetius]UYQ66603.1 PQQ-binding-like beta-propeller repeat protein [Streptomyces peucetius]
MPPLRSTGPFPEAEHPEFAGQYRLEACLGNGGMGVVHLATSASGLRLAVKVIHAEHASDTEFRARFRQEVAAARRVSGAFTAPVVDADPGADRPWMATLFIEGPTLAERVKRNGPLDPDGLRRAGAGLAEALRDIHRAGVVHRDLKPSNVLLAKDGPKVIDFGISRPVDSDLRTETGKLIGTPPFMAPEQFQRPREVGPEADVFALGAVLVHAATGRGPFDSDSPYIVAYQVVHNEPDLSGVPEDLVPLLARCLAKDPQARPTPYELMVALRATSPSSAYDTQAYIPAQRGFPGTTGKPAPEPDPGQEPEPGHAPKPLQAPKSGHAAAAASDVDPATADAPPRRRGRRSRWALAAAAFTVLASAGAVAISAAADDGAPVAPRTEPGFRPWSVALEDGAADATPVCSAGGEEALYCTAPGMKAARLNPADGSPVWSADAGDAAPAGASGQSDEGLAPQLAGGLLHVVTPGAGHYEALDPRTGEPRWDLDVPAYATVLTVGDTVLLVNDAGLVRAVDAATGEERWRKRHGGPGAHWVSHPGGDGPAIAAAPSPDGTSTRISAVDPRGGELLWSTRLAGSLTPVELWDGSLYLLSAGTDGFTRAVVTLDTTTHGRPVRRVPLTVPADQAQATVSGQVVYIAAAGGSLTAVDTARPAGSAQDAELWRLETGVAHLSRPVAGAGAVFLSAADGRLLAVDAKLGRVVGQTGLRMADDGSTYASLLPAPVVLGGRVYATAPDGSVFAVDAKDPARW